MGKKLCREVHHFYVLPSLDLRELRQQVFTEVYERCQNVLLTMKIMGNLPWEFILRQWLQERRDNLKSTLHEYLRLLLDEDPWLVKNFRK